MKLKVTYRKVSSLTPDSRNARTHGECQVAMIARSIESFGFVNPVLVDPNGVIIAGEGRWLAAKLLELDQVPAIELGHLSERERRALVLADNKIASKSGWDLEKLSTELSELLDMDADLSVTGFDEQELDALLREDASILPTDWHSDHIPSLEADRSEPEPSGHEDDESEPRESEPKEPAPKVTDDEYSRFDIVMRHEWKKELVELLSTIREDMGFERLEEALMELANHWKQTRR